MVTKTPLYYWIFLVIAIITEVIGTLAMKYSVRSIPLAGLGIMYFMLLLSYSSLAIAIQRISLTVAYGAWESLGLVLITLFSALLFSEHLNLAKIFAITIIIIGILLVNNGSITKSERT